MADDLVLRESLTTVVAIGAEMNRRVVSINERVAAMTNLAEMATAELASAVTPAGQTDVVNRLGRHLEDASGRLVADVDALEGAVTSIDEATTVILREAEALGRPDQPARVEANEVLTSLARLADQAAGGAGGFLGSSTS